MMKSGLLAVMLAAVIMLSSRTAGSEVNVNINIGVPPPVVVEAPPVMLFLGQPGLYVAVGIGYDIYYMSGRYYYFHDGHWFRGPGYGGPWVYVQDRSLPPGLRKYKIKDLHRFKDHEYKIYKTQGPQYKGRRFEGKKGPEHKEFRSKEHDKENGGSKNRGRGKD